MTGYAVFHLAMNVSIASITVSALNTMPRSIISLSIATSFVRVGIGKLTMSLAAVLK